MENKNKFLEVSQINKREIKAFEHEQFGKVRALLIDNKPYFVGKDVAEVLGYARPTKAIQDNVDEEDKDEIPVEDSIGRMQKTPIINESGLYSLILSSKLPKAKEFKRWVTSEVLPSIRKHGMYATDELLDNPDLLIGVATKLKEEREKNRVLEEEKKVNAPKVIFADAVATSKTSILVGELSKILKQNGVDIGGQRLFAWLRDNGYLIKRKGTDWNMPTQRSMEQGLFEIKEGTRIDGNGVNITTKTPKVTGKGQQYFINKFLNKEAM